MDPKTPGAGEILVERDKALFLHDFLPVRGENPVDVRFDLPCWVASRVEIQFSRDWILATSRHVHTRCNGGFAFLAGDLEPVHAGYLVPHSAVSHPGGSP